MKAKFILNSIKSERKELDVKLPLVLGIGLALTLIIYALLLPIKNTFLGILLYERGFTQFVVIIFTGIVTALIVLKFFKIKQQFQEFKQDLIPQNIIFTDPIDNQVINLQQNLAKENSLLARRCSRVLAAYIYSGNRQTATEFALEDSSFYQSSSESSYTVPRILIWAIPLLGFIGTVVGISGAVNGFSGFLEKSSDIDQIKQGIGTVTTGLAIAFDTTLLALFMSVLVMIPLVLVERLESRLLLAIDIYINDRLLPRLKNAAENLDKDGIREAVNDAVQKTLPSPEALIQPAQEYAKQAADALAKGFISEVSKIQDMASQVIEQMNGINQVILKERQDFVTALNEQIQTSKNLVTEQLNTSKILGEEQRKASRELFADIQNIIETMNLNNAATTNSIKEQSEQISQQLEKAAHALENRVSALEQYAAQVTEVAQLQLSLEQTLRSLKEKATLEQVLFDVQATLVQLKPALEQLNKPRRIMLVEQEDNTQYGSIKNKTNK